MHAISYVYNTTGIDYFNDRVATRGKGGLSQPFRVSNDVNFHRLPRIAVSNNGNYAAVAWGLNSGDVKYRRLTPSGWENVVSINAPVDTRNLEDVKIDDTGTIYFGVVDLTSPGRLLFGTDLSSLSAVGTAGPGFFPLLPKILLHTSGQYILWMEASGIGFGPVRYHITLIGGSDTIVATSSTNFSRFSGQFDSHGVLHYVYQRTQNETRHGTLGGGTAQVIPFGFNSTDSTLDIRFQMVMDGFDRIRFYGSKDFSGFYTEFFTKAGFLTNNPNIAPQLWLPLPRVGFQTAYLPEFIPENQLDYFMGLSAEERCYVDLPMNLKVNVCNGNLIVPIPMFSDSGRGLSSSLEVTYNSLSNEVGALGRGWTHNHEWSFSGYELRRPDGSRDPYSQISSTIWASGRFSPGESSYVDTNIPNEVIQASGLRRIFDSQGFPSEFRDTNQNTLTFTYGGNPNSNRVEIELPGQTEHLLNQVTDSAGRHTNYEYNSNNQLYRVTRASGDIYQFSYTSDARLSSIEYMPVQALPYTIRWEFDYWSQNDETTGEYKGLLKSIRTPRASTGGYDTALIYYTADRAVRCVQYAQDSFIDENGSLTQVAPEWQFRYEHPDFFVTPSDVTKIFVTDPRNNITIYECPQYPMSIVSKRIDPDNTPGNPSDNPYEQWTYTDNGPLGFSYRNAESYRDRNGNVTNYTYVPPPATPTPTQPYAVNLVETVTRPGQAAPTTYTYGVFNRLQTVTDPLGNQTVYGLDPNTGNVTSITHPATPTVLPDGSIVAQSATETFTYLPDGSGRIDTHASPTGGITDYNYGGPNDPSNTGLLTEIIRPGQAMPAQTKYDLLGNVTGTAPPGRPFTDLILDGLYRIKERREPQVGFFTSITKYTYDEDSNLLTVEDPRNNVTTYTYDKQGRRKTVTQPAPFSSTSTTDYDVNGNVRKTVDFKGNVATFTYDLLNRPLTQVLPGTPNRVTLFGEDVGGQIVNGYDPNGNLVLMTEVGDVANPNRITRHRYDVRNNRTHAIRVDNQGTKHFAERSQYDQNDRLTQSLLFESVDPVTGDGGTFRSGNGYTYDARNRRSTLHQATAVSTGDLIVGSLDTQFRYDANSNLRLTEDPLGVRSWTVYDASDRPVDQLAHDLRILRHTTYTEDDLADEVWTPKPSLAGPVFAFGASDFTRIQKNDYDDQQRLFRTTDADGHFTTTDYDGADNVLVVTDRRGFTKEWLSYDALNRPGFLREQVDTGTFVQTGYTYDANSNMETLLDPNTGLHTFTYDGGNRLQKLEYPPMTGGRRSEEWTYTPHGERYEHKWNSLTGSLSQKQTMTYDAFGRPARDLAQTGSGMTLNDVQRLWDAAGNLLKTEDITTGAKTVYGIESGGDVTGGYDALNRPVLSQYFQGGMLLKAVSTTWDNAGRRDTVLGTDGDRTRYAYDANGLMQNLYFQLPSGGELLQETQTYDAALRHKTTQDVIASLITTRTYDNRELLGQIETKKTSGTPISNIVYTRDPEGNLQTKTTIASGETNVVGYIHDGLGRILHEQWAGTVPYAASYGYDANGNRTAKKVIALTGKSIQGTGTLRKIVPAFEIFTSLPMYDEENRLTDSLVTKTSFNKLTPVGTIVSSTAPGFTEGALVDSNTPNTYDPLKTWASLDQPGNHTACLDLGAVTPVGQVKCWLPTTNGFFQRFKVTYWNGSGYSDIPAEGVFGAVAVSGSWYRNTQHEVTFNCFSVSTDKICFEMDSGGGAPGRPNQAALNELQAFKPVTTVQHAYTNTYDDTGNRIVRNDSTTGITETHSYDGFNRYIGYDRTGSNPTSVDYLLTPEGDRLARLTSTGNTWFINDGSDVLSDYIGSPGSLSPSLFYVNGLGIDDKRIRYSPGGTRHTYNTDHLGTPIQILNQSAQVTKSLRLNAWGEEVPRGGLQVAQPYPGGSGFSDRYHFTQRERMPESGLTYYRNRAYSPEEGVFIQKDSIASRRVGLPYQMASNNPTRYVDPWGLFDGERMFNEFFKLYGERGKKLYHLAEIDKVVVSQEDLWFWQDPQFQPIAGDEDGYKLLVLDSSSNEADAAQALYQVLDDKYGKGLANLFAPLASFQHRRLGFSEEEALRAEAQAARGISRAQSGAEEVVAAEASLIGGAVLARTVPRVADYLALRRLRKSYEAEVRGLTKLKDALQAQGKSKEEIARALHRARRELGLRYKGETPLPELEKIRQRNIRDYDGDPLGPTVEWLRQNGKSWDDIAESAIRPGKWPPK